MAKRKKQKKSIPSHRIKWAAPCASCDGSGCASYMGEGHRHRKGCKCGADEGLGAFSPDFPALLVGGGLIAAIVIFFKYRKP